jgi:hypothetical protein
MNINVNITVPVIESDNEVLQQSRPRANASPQAEDEGMGAFLQLPTLGDARDERFNQGFLDGWLSACNHWVSYSRIEREPPMIYLYPYRRDFERSECPLSRCVPADDHSDLGGGLGRNQIPQIQQSQAAQDANLAHALPRGLGFDNLNTRELWGTYEDGLEETHEVGPASVAHQPSEGVESSVSNHASPETSEVTPISQTGFGCVAVVKGGPRPEPTLPVPARIEIQGVKPNSILQRHLNSGYSLEHYHLPVGASCLPHAPRSSKGRGIPGRSRSCQVRR